MKAKTKRPKRAVKEPRLGSVPVPGLAEARRAIDDVDTRILDLLAARAAIAQEVAVLKRAADIEVFHDPEREGQVLDRLVAEKKQGVFPSPEGVVAELKKLLAP